MKFNKKIKLFSLLSVFTLFVFLVGCEDGINDDISVSDSFVGFSPDQEVSVEIGSTMVVDVDLYASAVSAMDRTFALSYSGTAVPSSYVAQSSVTIDAGATKATIELVLTGGDFTVNGSTIILSMNQSADTDQVTSYTGSFEDESLEVEYDTHTITAKDLCLANLVTLDITFDAYAEETAWQMILGGVVDGDVIDSGGISNGGFNFEYEGLDSFSKTWCLEDGNYNFIMYDYYSDGMCCTYGTGSYTVTLGDGTVVASGGSFGADDVTPFTL
jgi:hypothetical protein